MIQSNQNLVREDPLSMGSKKGVFIEGKPLNYTLCVKDTFVGFLVFLDIQFEHFLYFRLYVLS